MKTEDRRVCPSCGNEFSGAVEFCPVCMLHRALADDVESGESSSERVVKLKSQGVARRFQHYELLIGEDGRPVELGRGAMGVTYKAFDVDLRCPVTLKVISEKHLGDESARLRFLREARAAASVRHPNVASVFHLAKKLVRKGADEARVTLGWAPGGEAPFLIEASTTQGGVSLHVPRQELPPDEWFSIKAIVRDLELTERDWAADLLAGYFCQASAPWEQ